jgi:predicted SnoaL-like aldol condensation-catalyzing enzyme
MKRNWLMSLLEDNKTLVSRFYQMAFDGEPARAVELFVGDHYIQHNPHTADGTASFIDYVLSLHRSGGRVRLDIKRVIAENNLVVTHATLTAPSNEGPVALADIFRVENGKVVEHWDVIQPIPRSALNSNGMV